MSGVGPHDAAPAEADGDCLGCASQFLLYRALPSDRISQCRITGSATLLGVSAYFFHERNKVPRSKAGERRWLLVCTGAFAAAGLWRATTGLFDNAPPPSSHSEQQQQQQQQQ